MKLRVFHQTKYTYSEPVTLGHNQLHLSPREFSRQRCHSSRIRLEPLPTVSRIWRDVFGNEVTYFTIEEPHKELVIGLQALIEMFAPKPIANLDSLSWENVRDHPGSFRRNHFVRLHLLREARNVHRKREFQHKHRPKMRIGHQEF